MDSPIPTDVFSRALRQANDNPGALKASSTIEAADFYGNTETWVVTTFRIEAGREVVFLQRNSAEGGLRLVIPTEVVAALASQRERVQAAGRRRHGHKLVALRKQRGDTLGNPAALAAARRKRMVR